MLWTIIFIVFLVGYVIFCNQFIKLSKLIEKAWQELDDVLKQRRLYAEKLAELYPALAEPLYKLQQDPDFAQRQQAEKELSVLLQQFFTDHTNMTAQKQEWNQIEEKRQDAARYYNAAVRLYNFILKRTRLVRFVLPIKAQSRAFWDRT